MKKLFVLTFIFVITGCGTLDDHPAKMNELMSSGQCNEAERYANSTFRDDYLDWMMGNVALKCRRDKKKAINYYRAGARANTQFSNLSVRSLIELGETPPEPAVRYVDRPAPQPVQQKIIIQQQVPERNSAACIQDGGGTFCPNHPNTKSAPSPYRPVFN